MTIRFLDGIPNPKWCSNGDAKNEKVAKQMKMELEVETETLQPFRKSRNVDMY